MIEKMKSTEIINTDISEILQDIRKYSKIIQGKHLLLIGGKGFLGTYFLKTLVNLNQELEIPLRITVIDNLITAKDKNTIDIPNVKFVEADISQKLDLEEKVDFIIHAASIASPPIYRKYPLKTIDVNYQGTRNILEYAKKYPLEGFLLLSSSEIYGDPTIIPTPEDYWGHVSSTGPRACYDESKRLAETVSMTFFHLFKTPVKIARPFNVYGPYLNLDDGRVIPNFMKDAIKNSEIIIYSDGTPTRSFCYITDAIKAFLSILFESPPGEIFNVGNDEEISVIGLAEKIKNIIGTEINIKLEKNDDPNYTKDNPTRRCPNLSKIKNEMKYEPKIGLDEGLKRVYTWYVGDK